MEDWAFKDATPTAMLNGGAGYGSIQYAPASMTLYGYNPSGLTPKLATYTSGITATGSAAQTCTLTFTGGTTQAVGTVKLSATNAVAAGSVVTFSTVGTGYIAPPIAAAASNGTATCSGTVVVATALGAYAPFAVDASGNLVVSSATGTVTTSGSPVSGNIAAFSSSTAITAATAAQIVAAISTTAVANATAATTAANLSGTPALPNGTTATTQTAGDNSTKIATTAYVTSPGAITPTSVTIPADGVHPTQSTYVGNTTLPSISSNQQQHLGPPAATFTSWSDQVPSAIPTNLHSVYCAVSGTNCLWTDTGYAYNSIPNADLAGAPAGTIVGTTDTQALTNKTLTGPTNTVGLLNTQGPLAESTGTGSAKVMYTYTLPANSVALGQSIEIHCAFNKSTGTASVIYAASINGVAVGTYTFAHQYGGWIIDRITNTGATAGNYMWQYGNGWDGIIIPTGDPVTGLAWGSNQVINVTFNTTATTDKVTPGMFQVEIVH